MKEADIKYECVRLAEKLVFEDYISRQLKLDLMLKMYPQAISLYMENCPSSPTSEDIIEQAKKLYAFISGSEDAV